MEMVRRGILIGKQIKEEGEKAEELPPFQEKSF